MTEIQFLLTLVLEHKQSPAAKKLILERIGTVESQLNLPIVSSNALGAYIPPKATANAQCASTQRILDAMPLPALVPAAVAVGKPIALGGKLDKETGLVTVPTGRGTSGPRKF
jgi:hypothetical protein